MTARLLALFATLLCLVLPAQAVLLQGPHDIQKLRFSPLNVQCSGGTIATTSTTDCYIIAPQSGGIEAVTFSGIDALATSDSNYITFSVVNLGQTGSGGLNALAATAANTTKVTGGTALAANAKRTLTMAGNAFLTVAAGDRLRLRATATGTLAGTVTGSTWMVQFGLSAYKTATPTLTPTPTNTPTPTKTPTPTP